MKEIDVKIVTKDGGRIPQKATSGSAGYDLICPKDTELKDGRGIIKLNIRLGIPLGVAGLIKPRSGFEIKGFLVIDKWGYERRIDCNVKDGVIDSDYIGIVGVIINNCEHLVNGVCGEGTRIAQMLFIPVYSVNFIEVDELEETERMEGGYGSTGTR